MGNCASIKATGKPGPVRLDYFDDVVTTVPSSPSHSLADDRFPHSPISSNIDRMSQLKFLYSGKNFSIIILNRETGLIINSINRIETNLFELNLPNGSRIYSIYCHGSDDKFDIFDVNFNRIRGGGSDYILKISIKLIHSFLL